MEPLSMTTLLTALFVLTAVVIVLFGSIGIVLLINVIRINERTSSIKLVEHKLNQVENAVSAILESVNGPMSMMGMPNPPSKTVYRSADGKHTAESLEELLDKMAAAGDLNISKEAEDELRNFFKQATESIDETMDWDDDWDDEKDTFHGR